MKTVLLVDDHVLFRQSLRSLLGQHQPQWEFIEAGSLHTALRYLQQRSRHSAVPSAPVDLVLLDLTLKDSRGMFTLERLLQAHPQLAVLVLTGEENPELFQSAVAAGAVVALSKSADVSELLSAVGRVLSEPLLDRSVAGFGGAPSASQDDSFSGRQADVLRLLLQGKSNKLICRELALSESTVKTHLQAVFRKLDVNSRTQAVVAAARLGWSAAH
ncbi:MAG: response regulator transcription factor [Burkholderiales bacterium]|nr:response regulator transcription factor [Burkholderiales bacterium]